MESTDPTTPLSISTPKKSSPSTTIKSTPTSRMTTAEKKIQKALRKPPAVSAKDLALVAEIAKAALKKIQDSSSGYIASVVAKAAPAVVASQPEMLVAKAAKKVIEKVKENKEKTPKKVQAVVVPTVSTPVKVATHITVPASSPLILSDVEKTAARLARKQEKRLTRMIQSNLRDARESGRESLLKQALGNDYVNSKGKGKATEASIDASSSASALASPSSPAATPSRKAKRKRSASFSSPTSTPIASTSKLPLSPAASPPASPAVSPKPQKKKSKTSHNTSSTSNSTSGISTPVAKSTASSTPKSSQRRKARSRSRSRSPLSSRSDSRNSTPSTSAPRTPQQIYDAAIARAVKSVRAEFPALTPVSVSRTPKQVYDAAVARGVASLHSLLSAKPATTPATISTPTPSLRAVAPASGIAALPANDQFTFEMLDPVKALRKAIIGIESAAVPTVVAAIPAIVAMDVDLSPRPSTSHQFTLEDTPRVEKRRQEASEEEEAEAIAVELKKKRKLHKGGRAIKRVEKEKKAKEALAVAEALALAKEELRVAQAQVEEKKKEQEAREEAKKVALSAEQIAAEDSDAVRNKAIANAAKKARKAERKAEGKKASAEKTVEKIAVAENVEAVPVVEEVQQHQVVDEPNVEEPIVEEPIVAEPIVEEVQTVDAQISAEKEPVHELSFTAEGENAAVSPKLVEETYEVAMDLDTPAIEGVAPETNEEDPSIPDQKKSTQSTSIVTQVVTPSTALHLSSPLQSKDLPLEDDGMDVDETPIPETKIAQQTQENEAPVTEPPTEDESQIDELVSSTTLAAKPTAVFSRQSSASSAEDPDELEIALSQHASPKRRAPPSPLASDAQTTAKLAQSSWAPPYPPSSQSSSSLFAVSTSTATKVPLPESDSSSSSDDDDEDDDSSSSEEENAPKKKISRAPRISIGAAVAAAFAKTRKPNGFGTPRASQLRSQISTPIVTEAALDDEDEFDQLLTQTGFSQPPVAALLQSVEDEEIGAGEESDRSRFSELSEENDLEADKTVSVVQNGRSSSPEEDGESNVVTPAPEQLAAEDTGMDGANNALLPVVGEAEILKEAGNANEEELASIALEASPAPLPSPLSAPEAMSAPSPSQGNKPLNSPRPPLVPLLPAFSSYKSNGHSMALPSPSASPSSSKTPVLSDPSPIKLLPLPSPTLPQSTLPKAPHANDQLDVPSTQNGALSSISDGDVTEGEDYEFTLSGMTQESQFVPLVKEVPLFTHLETQIETQIESSQIDEEVPASNGLSQSSPLKSTIEEPLLNKNIIIIPQIIEPDATPSKRFTRSTVSRSPSPSILSRPSSSAPPRSSTRSTSSTSTPRKTKSLSQESAPSSIRASLRTRAPASALGGLDALDDRMKKAKLQAKRKVNASQLASSQPEASKAGGWWNAAKGKDGEEEEDSD